MRYSRDADGNVSFSGIFCFPSKGYDVRHLRPRVPRT
jgi:hypothetical protein